MSAAAPAEIPGATRLEGADANAIGLAIKDLWKAAADAREGGSVQRACVMNLAAVLEGDGQSGDTFRALDALAASHPARTVVVIPDASLAAGAALSDVSIFCSFMPGSGRHVCAERIVLRAAPDAVGHLHQTALALFVDELPRTVWWRVPGRDSTGILARLSPHVDALVIDGRDWPQDGASLESVAALRGGTELAVRDLNWGRLTPWRELMAQAFDAAEARAALHALDLVRIGAQPDPDGAPPLAALLLLGWLADRLGWRVASPASGADAGVAKMPCAVAGVSDARGRPVAVELAAAAHPRAERGIVSVTLRSEAPRTEFSFERTGSFGVVAACAETAGGSGLCRMVDFGTASVEALLAREVNYGARDTAYERALANAARFARMHPA